MHFNTKGISWRPSISKFSAGFYSCCALHQPLFASPPDKHQSTVALVSSTGRTPKCTTSPSSVFSTVTFTWHGDVVFLSFSGSDSRELGRSCSTVEWRKTTGWRNWVENRKGALSLLLFLETAIVDLWYLVLYLQCLTNAKLEVLFWIYGSSSLCSGKLQRMWSAQSLPLLWATLVRRTKRYI